MIIITNNSIMCREKKIIIFSVSIHVYMFVENVKGVYGSMKTSTNCCSLGKKMFPDVYVLQDAGVFNIYVSWIFFYKEQKEKSYRTPDYDFPNFQKRQTLISRTFKHKRINKAVFFSFLQFKQLISTMQKGLQKKNPFPASSLASKQTLSEK